MKKKSLVLHAAIMVVVAFTVALFSSCEKESPVIENEAPVTYSKTITLYDSEMQNSIDLVATADDESLLELFTENNFKLSVIRSYDELGDGGDSTTKEDESAEEPADEDEDILAVRVSFSIQNEKLEDGVIGYRITTITPNDDSRAKKYDFDYESTRAKFTIKRTSWWYFVSYKWEYRLIADGKWYWSEATYISLAYNSPVSKNRPTGADRMRVWVSATRDSHFTLTFSD